MYPISPCINAPFIEWNETEWPKVPKREYVAMRCTRQFYNEKWWDWRVAHERTQPVWKRISRYYVTSTINNNILNIRDSWALLVFSVLDATAKRSHIDPPHNNRHASNLLTYTFSFVRHKARMCSHCSTCEECEERVCESCPHPIQNINQIHSRIHPSIFELSMCSGGGGVSLDSAASLDRKTVKHQWLARIRRRCVGVFNNDVTTHNR